MSFSGYFSFKRFSLKLSHFSANRSGEDERQWARFNIVIKGSFVTGINMILIVEKKAFICCFPVDTFSAVFQSL